jgi:hypothetical protein
MTDYQQYEWPAAVPCSVYLLGYPDTKSIFKVGAIVVRATSYSYLFLGYANTRTHYLKFKMATLDKHVPISTYDMDGMMRFCRRFVFTIMYLMINMISSSKYCQQMAYTSKKIFASALIIHSSKSHQYMVGQ